MSFTECEGKEFVVLDVMPGVQTPYYYIGDGQMQAFVRIGNESVVASISKHKELVLKGSNMLYDSQVSRWRFEDMAFTVLRATYFKRTNRSFDDSDYESFGIINEKGELTNAGALLADFSPDRNYLELGSEVHIDMYDDRLEIFSPGGLLDGGSIKVIQNL